MSIQKIKPQEGQESAWDYPRPPRLEDSVERIKVVVNGIVIAESHRAKRVLETSHPPVYYLPPEDVRRDMLVQNSKKSFCEWKGTARYYDILCDDDRRIQNAAWAYPSPTASFEVIRDYLAFYPHLMDACFVGEEQVQSQAGGFYGGWITKNIVGPFKGEPGTQGW